MRVSDNFQTLLLCNHANFMNANGCMEGTAQGAHPYILRKIY